MTLATQLLALKWFEYVEKEKKWAKIFYKTFLNTAAEKEQTLALVQAFCGPM